MPLLFDELPLLERLRLYGPLWPPRHIAGSVVYPPAPRSIENIRSQIKKTAGKSHAFPTESDFNEV